MSEHQPKLPPEVSFDPNDGQKAIENANPRPVKDRMGHPFMHESATLAYEDTPVKKPRTRKSKATLVPVEVEDISVVAPVDTPDVASVDPGDTVSTVDTPDTPDTTTDGGDAVTPSATDAWNKVGKLFNEKIEEHARKEANHIMDTAVTHRELLNKLAVDNENGPGATNEWEFADINAADLTAEENQEITKLYGEFGRENFIELVRVSNAMENAADARNEAQSKIRQLKAMKKARGHEDVADLDQRIVDLKKVVKKSDKQWEIQRNLIAKKRIERRVAAEDRDIDSEEFWSGAHGTRTRRGPSGAGRVSGGYSGSTRGGGPRPRPGNGGGRNGGNNGGAGGNNGGGNEGGNHGGGNHGGGEGYHEDGRSFDELYEDQEWLAQLDAVLDQNRGRYARLASNYARLVASRRRGTISNKELAALNEAREAYEEARDSAGAEALAELREAGLSEDNIEVLAVRSAVIEERALREAIQNHHNRANGGRESRFISWWGRNAGRVFGQYGSGSNIGRRVKKGAVLAIPGVGVYAAEKVAEGLPTAAVPTVNDEGNVEGRQVGGLQGEYRGEENRDIIMQRAMDRRYRGEDGAGPTIRTSEITELTDADTAIDRRRNKVRTGAALALGAATLIGAALLFGGDRDSGDKPTPPTTTTTTTEAPTTTTTTPNTTPTTTPEKQPTPEELKAWAEAVRSNQEEYARQHNITLPQGPLNPEEYTKQINALVPVQNNPDFWAFMEARIKQAVAYDEAKKAGLI